MFCVNSSLNWSKLIHWFPHWQVKSREHFKRYCAEALTPWLRHPSKNQGKQALKYRRNEMERTIFAFRQTSGLIWVNGDEVESWSKFSFSLNKAHLEPVQFQVYCVSECITLSKSANVLFDVGAGLCWAVDRARALSSTRRASKHQDQTRTRIACNCEDEVAGSKL